jgi:hypothetical protein
MYILLYTHASIQTYTCSHSAMQSFNHAFMQSNAFMCSLNYLSLTDMLIHSFIHTRSRCLARALSLILSTPLLYWLNTFYYIITCAHLLQRFLLYHRIRSPVATLSILSLSELDSLCFLVCLLSSVSALSIMHYSRMSQHSLLLSAITFLNAFYYDLRSTDSTLSIIVFNYLMLSVIAFASLS